MVLQLLDQADLSLLFYRLVGGTVFTYAEGIVSPDELDGHFHQGSHADGGLHVVAEDEEGAASGYDATMERHTDADASHGQLGHTGLEEGSAEVALGKGVGLLEETIRLVGVA